MITSTQILSFIKETTKKETPTQSAEPSTEEEQPVEETKETLLNLQNSATEKEQPVEETKETLLNLQNLQQKKNNL